MSKLLTLLVLALSLTGISTISYATDQGAKSTDMAEKSQMKAEDSKAVKDKKKKNKGEEEEPECE